MLTDDELDRIYAAQDDEWHALNNQIESDGYEFGGSVFLPSDSDDGSCDCPMCGKTGYWVVLYHKPDNHDDCACANQCYDCGHMWRD